MTGPTRLQRALPHAGVGIGAVCFIGTSPWLWFGAGLASVAATAALALISASYVVVVADRDQERDERHLVEKQLEQALADLAAERIDRSGEWILTPLFGKAAAVNGRGRHAS